MTFLENIIQKRHGYLVLWGGIIKKAMVLQWDVYFCDSLRSNGFNLSIAF